MTQQEEQGAHGKDGQEHHGEYPPLPKGAVETPESLEKGYIYRPDQVLVGSAGAEAVAAELRRRRARYKVVSEDKALGVRLLRFAAGTDVPTLVTELRSAGHIASPHHVLHPATHVIWISAEPPQPAPPPKRSLEKPNTECVVAVVDNGVWEKHPWLDGHYRTRGPQDVDTVPAAGEIPISAGHGTFVTGMVLQHAPSSSVLVRRVGDGDGLTDDLTLADAILGLRRVRGLKVVNLSLGGHAHDDTGLPATEAAIRALLRSFPDLVIVAGAGNDGSDRPFFPAAFKPVVAVGALDGKARAEFSNFGWWVDTWAPGVDVVSTFPECVGPLSQDWLHPFPDLDLDAGPFKGWARWSGTSFAAPQIAGKIAAKICSGLTPAEAVRGALRPAP